VTVKAMLQLEKDAIELAYQRGEIAVDKFIEAARNWARKAGDAGFITRRDFT
jgi:hypothetical protein